MHKTLLEVVYFTTSKIKQLRQTRCSTFYCP